MTVLAFPSGFPEGLSIRGVPLLMAYPGKVHWVGNSATLLSGETTAVDSVSSSAAGQSNSPFATIDFAIGQCAANRGDIVIVRPNHVETVTAAAGLALDVAGIALVGLGIGSNRPTISFTTAATASMVVSAANISMTNFLFSGGINALANPVHVQAADFALLNCEYRDTSTFETVDAVVTTAAADRLYVDGFKYAGSAAAGADTCFSLVGTDEFTLQNFDIRGLFAVAAIELVTTLSANIRIKDGVLMNLAAATPILVGGGAIGTSTGRIGPNIFCQIGTGATGDIAAAFPTFGGNYMNPINVVNSDSGNVTGLAVVKAASSDA